MGKYWGFFEILCALIRAVRAHAALTFKKLPSEVQNGQEKKVSNFLSRAWPGTRALSNPGFGVVGVDSFAGFYGVESWFPPESTPLGKKFIAANLTDLT